MKIIKLSSFVGLDITSANDLAASSNLKSRIVAIDGKPMKITDNRRTDRVNFTVIDNVVTFATVG